MKKSKIDVEKLKSDILDTALQVFLTKNYSEVNIKDISDRLGITRTPIYYHFTNKYEIYAQVAESYLMRKINMFREILMKEDNFYHKIRQDLSLCTRQAISENIIFSEISTNPELKEILHWRKEAFDTIFSFKLAAVRAAIKKKELSPAIDEIELVNYLYLLHFGFLEMLQCSYHDFSSEMIETLIDRQIENIRALYGWKETDNLEK